MCEESNHNESYRDPVFTAFASSEFVGIKQFFKYEYESRVSSISIIIKIK